MSLAWHTAQLPRLKHFPDLGRLLKGRAAKPQRQDWELQEKLLASF
jgi:hypothetical protein